MNIEKERERFEAYYKLNYGYQEDHVFFRDEAGYINRYIQQEWNGWCAAKQDEMSEERARDILQIENDNGAGFCEITNLGLMLINNYQVAVSKSNSDSYTKDYLKAIVWFMENKP